MKLEHEHERYIGMILKEARDEVTNCFPIYPEGTIFVA